MQKLAALFVLCAPLTARPQTWHISQTFGSMGSVHADPGAGSDYAHSHLLLPNGRLLLGGEGYDINANAFHAGFVQLDTVCGALDTSFGTGGMASVILEQRTRMWNMTVQGDGRIVGCGMIAPSNAGSQQWPGVFRLHADGSIDSSFNQVGYHRLQFNAGTGDFSNCFVNADGSIVCTATGFFSGIGAVRFHADGTLDDSYGNGGTAAFALPSICATSKANGVMRPDGSVVSIGLTWSGTANDYFIALAQFNAAGEPDPDFGTGGLQVGPVVVDPSNTADGGLGASLLPDGRILVSCAASGTDQGFLMARYLPDGTPDSTYAVNGVSVVLGPTNARGARHELLPDGTTRQYGSVMGSHGLCLARDADGAAIPTFGSNGFAAGPVIITQEGFLGGHTMADGRILGYGHHANLEFTAVRMTTDPVADLLPVISASGSDLVTTGSGALQWLLDGVDLAGATGSSITPAQNGTYTVEMSISPDCNYTSPPYAFLNLGLSDLAPSDVHIQGNVVDGALMVINSGQRVPYVVMDIRGREIATGTLSSGTNLIDLAGAPSGSYLLRVPRNDGPMMQRYVIARQ